MADAQWPASLPQHVEVTGFRGSPPDEFEESTPEKGPPMRNRIKRGGEVESIDCVIWVTDTEWAVLLAFHRDTLLGGTEPFNWVHPIGRAPCEMEFRPGGLTYTLRSGKLLQVQMKLRVLP